MRMTISCTKDFFNLLDHLAKKSNFKKSKIVEIAVKEWSKKWIKK